MAIVAEVCRTHALHATTDYAESLGRSGWLCLQQSGIHRSCRIEALPQKRLLNRQQLLNLLKSFECHCDALYTPMYPELSSSLYMSMLYLPASCAQALHGDAARLMLHATQAKRQCNMNCMAIRRSFFLASNPSKNAPTHEACGL